MIKDFFDFRVSNSSGLFSSSLFETNLIGTSDCNLFVPLYSLLGHTLLTFPGDVKVLEYSLPGTTSYYAGRQYSRVISELIQGIYIARFPFRILGEEHEVFIFRGIIYDEDQNILMSLSVESEYVVNTPYEDICENADPNKFVLFVSSTFREPKYKNLLKKIETLYINPLKEMGVDVIETSKINYWLFKNNFEKPKFKSLKELNNHLKEDISKLVFKE